MTLSLSILAGFFHVGLLFVYISNLLYLKRRRSAPLSSPAPLVSILIPARNEAVNLKRLLPTLLAQAYPAFEVIVYDDDSDDATWEVLTSISDDRLRPIRGTGLAPGWVGKVHALYQATRHARGTCFLFLDADAEMTDINALERIVTRFLGMPENSVLTGLPRYRGGGMMLVSLVPNAILTAIPWWLVRPLKIASLGALNGQCWMIDAVLYRRFEPHKHVANEILEDVLIGRYLKRNGITPVLADVQHELVVRMYTSLGEAWRGFRKNAYLMMGARFPSFIFFFMGFVFIYVLAPLLYPWLYLLIFLNKGLTDWKNGISHWISLGAPLSFLLGSTLQVDSAWNHFRGNISWKGRSVTFL